MKASVLVLLFLAFVARAMGTITVWSGDPNNVFIDSFTGTVTILAPGTFKMHSVANGSLAPINHIFVADGVTGAVEVHVRRNPADNAGIEGASDVGEIDLTNDQSTLTGALVELHITGDLGTLGPIVVTSLAGTTTVVGDVLDSITVSEYFTSTLTVGSLEILNLTRDCCDFPHSGSITVTDDFSGSISAVMRLTGAIHFCGDMGGTLDLFEYSGQMDVEGDLTGTIEVEQLSGDVRVHGRLASSGQIKGPFAQSSLSGSVTVYGDIEGGLISYPVVNSLSSEYQGASIHVLGSLTGSRTSPLINIGTLGTVVAVNGTLTDANTNGPEIQVTSFTAGSYVRGAISIDYDANGLDDPTVGQDDAAWRNGARIKVGSQLYARDDGNTQSIRVWNVRDCRGDFNSDGSVDTGDTSLFLLALNNASGDDESYQFLWAGLMGSRVLHGDANFSGGFTSDDQAAFTNLVTESCCVQSNVWCGGDVDHDFDTDFTDLALLLSHFGNTESPPRSSGNLDGDGDVDIQDLATLLANFGQTCCPSGVTEPLTGGITTTVQVFDTGAYSGGGLAGEVKHFVFDVLVQMGKTGDDWIGSGVIATAANSATFRIVPDAENPPVPTSATPDKYATFFSQPYANVNGSNRFNSPFTSGGIAGGYSPTGSGYAYTTSTIDASWYDMNSASNDGPAAVFRLVINVENVSGADVSGGLGSVYFSTTGPAQQGDIKVADMTFEPVHAYTHSSSVVTTGSFFVNGQ